MTQQRSLAEAKARFSECVHAVELGDDVIITRHGKPVAALVPIAELETLRRLRAAGGGLASLAGTLEEADELLASLEAHRRSGPRAVQGPG